MPPDCATCQHGLTARMIEGVEKRQVFDVPPPRLEVTEHQAAICCCAHCRATTTASFPDGVSAHVQCGKRIRAAAVCCNVQQLIPEDRVCQLLRDLFGAFTHYRVSPRRGAVPTFPTGGTIVHDHWKSYCAHMSGVDAHALCGAHHLRELRAIAEIGKEPWATELSALLNSANQLKATAQGRDEDQTVCFGLRGYSRQMHGDPRRGPRLPRTSATTDPKIRRPRSKSQTARS